MSTKIYLIRHAEAEGNLYRRVHGHYDSNVTELGMRQMEALRARFADVRVDAVYASDLVRAATTAGAISGPRGLKVHTSPHLREVYMGHWEDLTWARLEREEPEQLRYFARDPMRWDTGTNETFLPLTARIRDGVTRIAKKHKNKTVCIVSHGNTIRTLLASISNIPSERISEVGHCDNTGVSLLTWKEGCFHIHYGNDASHLSPEISTFARQNWWRDTPGYETGNVDFFPINSGYGLTRYLSYRRAAWKDIYGDLADYSDAEYLPIAGQYATAHPRALVEAYLRDKPIGMLELDVNHGYRGEEGAISFLYIDPVYRGRRLGAQLIGHAVSVYRELGRKRLSLKVEKINLETVEFLERLGFYKTGEIEAGKYPVWLMEMDIRVRIR